MIRSHPRKERSYSMTDEAAFFHQVRALVHQSRTILAGKDAAVLPSQLGRDPEHLARPLDFLLPIRRIRLGEVR